MCYFSVSYTNEDEEEEAREKRRRAREERKKMREVEESETTDVIDTNRYNVQKQYIPVFCETNRKNNKRERKQKLLPNRELYINTAKRRLEPSSVHLQISRLQT